MKGRDNLSRAIRVAKQVFRTLTEYVQVRGFVSLPCYTRWLEQE